MTELVSIDLAQRQVILTLRLFTDRFSTSDTIYCAAGNTISIIVQMGDNIPQGDPANGAKIFKQRCAQCHTTEKVYQEIVS